MPATTAGRVTWAFRNVSRSFNFWPTLESVEIVDAHPEEQATFSCRVEDPDEMLTFDNEDVIRVTVDDGGGAVKIFEGRIKQLTYKDHGRSGPRAYNLSCNDWTVLGDEDIITSKGARPTESAADRIDWIIGFSSKGLTLDAGSTIPAVNVDKGDHYGQTVLEALEDVLGQLDTTNVSYYVDFDKAIHIFTTEATSAPFDLAAGTASPPDSYPFWDWEHVKDTAELGNAVLVIGDKDQQFYTDASSISDWGRREFSVEDADLKSGTAMNRAASHALSNQAQPIIDGHMTIRQPGIRAAMAIEISHHLWDEIAANSPYIVKQVTTRALDPHDDVDGMAYIDIEVVYTDRYRIKFKGGKGPGDADKEDGDAITPSSLLVREARELFDWFVDNAVHTNVYANPANKFAGQGIYHNIPYTTCGCPIGNGGWSGRAEIEFWIECNPGALDDDLLGIRVEIQMGDSTNFWGRTKGPWAYGYKSTVPTGVREGIKLGHVANLVPDGLATFFIPVSYLTESTTNYWYIGPDWPGIAGSGFFCAQDIVDGVHGPMGADTSGGEGASGQIKFPTASAISVYGVYNRKRGLTNWLPVIGDTDGENRTFELMNWNGKGVPRVRVGAVILSSDDFEYDMSTGQVTLDEPPDEGDRVAASYLSAGSD